MSEPTPSLTPQAFQRDHVADDPQAELAALVRVLDLQERMPSVIRLRDWALAGLAPQPGERAVDVGCGTGAEVDRMAALVGPDGEAVGVEPHPGLRAEAHKRLAARAHATAVDGDAAALPFDDESVDVLRCERVFQHLPDPQAAAREIVRVLRPGGRAVVIDTDWETAVMSMGDPDVVRRLLEASRSRMPQPRVGRQLRRLLTRAGLVVDPDIAAAAVVLPDDELRRMEFLRLQAEAAIAEGVLAREEAEQLERDVIAAVDAGEAFFAVTMFGVVGRRPSAV